MRIETSSGHTILADDSDYPVLGEYGWYVSVSGSGRTYAHARIPGDQNCARVSMHRLLMQPPRHLVVHHKNNDGLDNRRCNLMVTTQRVNTRYAVEGIKGVHMDKRTGNWRAQPRDETGKQVSLGTYSTENGARAAIQNWNYRKMLELEALGDAESQHLAQVIEQGLVSL